MNADPDLQLFLYKFTDLLKWFLGGSDTLPDSYGGRLGAGCSATHHQGGDGAGHQAQPGPG